MTEKRGVRRLDLPVALLEELFTFFLLALVVASYKSEMEQVMGWLVETTVLLVML